MPTSTLTRFANIVDGERRTGGPMLDVLNPADESLVAQCALAEAADLDAAAQAAQVAFLSWSRTGYDERQAAINGFADRIQDAGDDLARLLTLEQGKPLRNAVAEIDRGVDTLRRIARFRPATERFDWAGRRLTELRWRPLGVTAAIVAWNAPVSLGLVKVANALIAGNSVIWKPSPFTPLTTLAVGELSIGCLPDGLLNVLAGDDAFGAALVAHPLVRKISFTGSVRAGKAIQASAAGTLKRVTLELGGNDAAIVLADADIDYSARKLVEAALWTTGQFCAAAKRIYVHASIKDQLVAAMIAAMRGLTVGNGLDDASMYGPIQNAPQWTRLRQIREQALSAGGRVLFEGAVPDGGYFFPLTLVDGVGDTEPLVAEEQFGPILPILTFTDEDDVIARANAVDYGLGGSVWSRDIDHALALAERLDVGNAWVNQHGVLDVGIPFPFAKESGIGIDYGDYGTYQFLQPTLVSVAE